MGSKDCLDCDWFDGIYGCGCILTPEEKKYDCPLESAEVPEDEKEEAETR